MGQIFEKGGIRVFPINEIIQAHRPDYALQLPPAHAVAEDVHGLKLYPPLLEIPLRLFGVEALGLAENLNVHGMILLLFFKLRQKDHFFAVVFPSYREKFQGTIL